MSVDFDLARVIAEIGVTHFDQRVRHFGVVGSTNQMAIEAAAAGAQASVWIADEQTAGRGRGGHTWHSTPGDGLYISLLVRPAIPLNHARDLPMAAGLATRAAVLAETGLTLDLRWPNDLMFEDRKCGGILVESAAQPAPQHWLPAHTPALAYAVIGIGLNLNHAAFPAELKAVATSLYLESGRHFDRESLAAAIIREIEREVSEIVRGFHGHSNGPGIQERFTAVSSWVSGKRVRVGADEAGTGGYTGWTRGLNRDGFLLVEDDSGVLRTVLSGGVRSSR